MLIIASLIFIGILLMLIEMLLIPGVGIAGILSLASLAGSCYYAFAYLSTKAGIIVTIIVMCLLIGMLAYILRAKTWKRFEMNTVIDSKVNEDSQEVKPGDEGETLTRLAPMGTAMFGEKSCEVKSHDNSMIGAGTPVVVVRIEENKIIVKPKN